MVIQVRLYKSRKGWEFGGWVIGVSVRELEARKRDWWGLFEGYWGED